MRNISSIIIILSCVFFTSCIKECKSIDVKSEKLEIKKVITNWHKAASEANFDAYFNKMTDDAIYIGTDPTENWDIAAFKDFSKPYFDAGKAWSFTAIERNVFVKGDMAWFDELLDTQMKICRGSGVLLKVDGIWKIKHYVLSIAIPNENVSEVIVLKQDFDDKIIAKLN